MSLIDTLCKGGWDVEDKINHQIFTRECPLRKNCLRYKARHNIAMVPFFDEVPVKAYMEKYPTAVKIECTFFINWN